MEGTGYVRENAREYKIGSGIMLTTGCPKSLPTPPPYRIKS